MKVECAGAVRIRAGAAEILETIGFEQLLNSGGAVGRSFCGGHPAVDLGNDVTGHGDGFDFEAGVAEKMEEFTERERTGVRRIAENLELILIGGAFRVFAGYDVFDEDAAVVAADASHFRKDFGGLLKVVEGEAADDYIEFAVVEREMADIAGAEREVGDVVLLAAGFGDLQHGVSQVDADDFFGDSSEGLGNVAWTSGNVEDAFGAGAMGSGDEAGDEVRIGGPRLGGEGSALIGEGLPDAVVVLRHDLESSV